MIAHLQRATTTAALIPALYGHDHPRYRLRPRLIGADYRGADKQLPLFGDPQEVLGGGVLDAPALRIGSRAPERPVWMCSVRSDPRHPDLTDAQWADVARRLLSATGIAPAGDPVGCRWAAIRNLDRCVHIVATVVREDGSVHSTYRDAFHAQAECHRIAADLGHLTRSVPSVTTAKDYRMPIPPISITIEPSGSVVARGSSDDLSAALIKHAGFLEKADWYGRRHRLPTTTATADRAAIATHAAEMLRAARYDVDLDPRLDTELLPGRAERQRLTTAGEQVLQLTDRIRGAADFGELSGVLDELLDPHGGVLDRVHEAMEAASEQITDLDPDQFALSDRFGFAADFISAAQGELAGALDDVQRARSHQAPADTASAAVPYSVAATEAARSASPAVTARGRSVADPAAAAPPSAASPRPAGRIR
ncbi:hypothetical protein PUR71_28970 [Streptomyces sp. SP17BM10]|uniref:hypothetical protein n=1 Tax=Streptomyces sp. SP17BM10 TaxID=3002530 RepID=UPI002E785786|nr:hypothetical protein [Streptomyces sp. SP17BM10]MEE1786907.1 hypothetical protein [Streptomyces sp. SP17BM10]